MVPDLKVILQLTAPGTSGLKVEGFKAEDVATTGSAPISKEGGIMATLGALSFFGIFLVTILASFGAARLSWCYNMYIGNSTGISAVYAFLAFMFSGFYYPFYAWFLNPTCGSKAAGATLMGGRRR